jgi:hypothetical protein
MRAIHVMRFGAFVLIALMGAGCSTSTTIVKIDPATPGTAVGQRFALPSRYVLMEPQVDGSVAAKYVFLPDDANTFAVSGKSFLTKNVVSVTVESGILKMVSSKSYATEVPSQIATTAGAARADEVTTTLAEATTKQTAEKKLKDEIAAAELAVKQAEAKLAIAIAAVNGDETKLIAFRGDVEVAKLKLADLQRQLGLIQAANDSEAVKPTHAYGPRLFLIVDERGADGKPTVRLEPVDAEQAVFRVLTATAATQQPEPAAGCPDLASLNPRAVFEGNSRKLTRLAFGPDFQYASLTVALFDAPEKPILRAASHTSPTVPADGVIVPPGTDLTVTLSTMVNGRNCPVAGNLRLP